jgi:endonuclease YncB( thermonuclease family)
LATLLLLLLTIFPAFAADTFIGKVVGITDGDTISVLRAGRAVKVRLDGIDCPESGDPFSKTAKQFTSKFSFGKEVQVRQTDTDRYGRIVARDGRRHGPVCRARPGRSRLALP